MTILYMPPKSEWTFSDCPKLILPKVNLMLMEYKEKKDRVLNFEEFVVSTGWHRSSNDTFHNSLGDNGSDQRSRLDTVQTSWGTTNHWERHEESFQNGWYG